MTNGHFGTSAPWLPVTRLVAFVPAFGRSLRLCATRLAGPMCHDVSVVAVQALSRRGLRPVWSDIVVAASPQLGLARLREATGNAAVLGDEALRWAIDGPRHLLVVGSLGISIAAVGATQGHTVLRMPVWAESGRGFGAVRRVTVARCGPPPIDDAAVTETLMDRLIGRHLGFATDYPLATPWGESLAVLRGAVRPAVGRADPVMCESLSATGEPLTSSTGT